LVEQFIR